MKRTLYVCQCGSLEHALFVCAEDEDFFLEVHLAPLPFWRRLRNAVGYVFGRRSRYGDFEEVLLSPADALDLGDKLTEWASGESYEFRTNDVY
jgi:hypothetical protein